MSRILYTTSALLLVLAAGLSAQPVSLGTGFTYQGTLTDQGMPAAGNYDFEFLLYNEASSGIELTPSVERSNVSVDTGEFTVELDFGLDPFNGQQLWLSVSVRRAGETDFTLLSPRQKLTAAPFALHALSVEMDAIDSLTILDDSITAADIASGAIGASEIEDGAVGPDALADNSIGSSAVRDDSLTDRDLAPNSVGAEEAIANEVQLRITGVCIAGEVLLGINENGSVICGDLPGEQSRTHYDLDQGPTVGGTSANLLVYSDGYPAFSYRGTGGELRILRCNDLACLAANAQNFSVDDTVNADGLLADDAEIVALGLTTRAIAMSYYDGITQSLKFAYCGPVCDGGAGLILDDPAGTDVGAANSMAISTDGNPVISYYDRTNGDLRVIKCNDVRCQAPGEQITVIDASPNDVGLYNAIAVPSDGVPLIAYFDITDGLLLMARCNDPTCAEGSPAIWQIAPMFGDGNRGVELLIGQDDLPLIVFRQLDGLTIVKCKDPRCDPNQLIISKVGSSVGGYNHATALGQDGLPILFHSHFMSSRIHAYKCNDAACRGGDGSDFWVGHGRPWSATIGHDGLPLMIYYEAWAATSKSHSLLRCGRPDCRTD